MSQTASAPDFSAVAAGSSSDSRPRRDVVARAIDIAFVLFLAVTVIVLMWKTRGLEFAGDDWRIMQRGSTIGDYLQPYNNQLSIVPIAVYRSLDTVFGLGSTLPLRFVGISSLAAVSFALFALVRARVGSAPAFVAGTALLWYPGLELLPVTFNYYFALTATIGCAYLLTRLGTRADILCATCLTFALCTSSVGIAGAIGAVVFVVLQHPRPTALRWMAVTAPTAAWALW